MHYERARRDLQQATEKCRLTQAESVRETFLKGMSME